MLVYSQHWQGVLVRGSLAENHFVWNFDLKLKTCAFHFTI